MQYEKSDVEEDKEQYFDLPHAERVLSEGHGKFSNGIERGDELERPAARVRDLDQGQAGVDEVHGAVDVPPQRLHQGLAHLLLGEHPRLGVPLDLAPHLGDALVTTLHVLVGSLTPGYN